MGWHSWHVVADALADRLRLHAGSCPVWDGAVGRGEPRPTQEERAEHDRVSCPFCRDSAAVEVYDLKAGLPPESDDAELQAVAAAEAERIVWGF